MGSEMAGWESVLGLVSVDEATEARRLSPEGPSVVGVNVGSVEGRGRGAGLAPVVERQEEAHW